MPLSDTYTLLLIDKILVNRSDRQRRKIETEDLQKSIKQIGLINPLIVARQPAECSANCDDPSCPYIHTESFLLIAGERRLEALRALGEVYAPVRFADSLSPVESSIIELEENIKRQDLHWLDFVPALAKIHQLHLSLDHGWTMAETAESVSLSLSTVSLYLRVNAGLDDPRIRDCGTVREAYNILARRDQRQMGNALSSLLEDTNATLVETSNPSPPPLGTTDNGNAQITKVKPKDPTVCQSILHESFLDWAPQYTGPKFNLIHIDFPREDPETFFQLLDCFAANFDRFASISCHIMFWYSAMYEDSIIEGLKIPLSSVNWAIHPLIWLRTDNSGISPDSRRLPRHIYETCLFGSRGNRNLVRVTADAYASPSDRSLHPNTKPEPMLRHFFQMVVDEHTSLLDPTCGSGAALRAAESLGAPKVLGLESNWDYCEAARKALKDARQLRRLTRS